MCKVLFDLWEAQSERRAGVYPQDHPQSIRITFLALVSYNRESRLFHQAPETVDSRINRRPYAEKFVGGKNDGTPKWTVHIVRAVICLAARVLRPYRMPKKRSCCLEGGDNLEFSISSHAHSVRKVSHYCCEHSEFLWKALPHEIPPL